jgi:hypothetical protein
MEGSRDIRHLVHSVHNEESHEEQIIHTYDLGTLA